MSQGDYLMQRRYIFEKFRNSYLDEYKALSVSFAFLIIFVEENLWMQSQMLRKYLN